MVHRAGFAGRMGPPSGGRRFTTILSPEMVSVPSYVTFTRASSGTHFDSTGALVTDSTDVARFDYNPLTLQPRGLLLEGARTNLAIRSNEFTNTGGWGTVSATVNQLSGTSIGLNRFEVVSSGGDFNRTESATGAALSVTSGTVYSVTLYFENTGTSGRLRVNLRDNTGAVESRITGAIGSLAPATSAAGTWSNVVETVVSGNVRRLTANFTPNFTGTNARLGFGPDSAVAGQTCVILAAQFELGAFASSYIPTTGTAATRAADVCTITNLSSIGYNALESTILAEFEYMGIVSVAGQRVIEISDGTVNERLGIGISSSGRLSSYVVDGGAVQASIDVITTPLANTIYKTAFGYKENDFAASANGGAVSTDTLGTLPTTTQANLGSSGNLSTANFAFSWLRRFTYYPTRLSNAQLQALSTL